MTKSKWPALGLLLLVNLIAASFLYSPGTEDVNTWDRWSQDITAYGVGGGFAHSRTDYPPLSFVFLAAVVQVAHALGISWFIALKSSLLLFLVASSACFYWFTRNLILTAGFELAQVLNSVALGYLDVYFGLFVIVALFLLQRGNLGLGLVLFTTSCFIKWQPLIIAPFVAIYVLAVGKDRTGADRLLRVLAPFVLSAVAVVIPVFAFFGASVFETFRRVMSWGDISAYALNLGWIHTWALHLIQPDKYGALRSGVIDLIFTQEAFTTLPEKALFYPIYAFILVVFARQKKTFERLLSYSILGYMSYFVLAAGVHENHLFLISCLAWILVSLDSDFLVPCLSLSIVANANLLLFYGIFGTSLPFAGVIAGVDVTLCFAVANICLFCGLLFHKLKAEGLGAGFSPAQ